MACNHKEHFDCTDYKALYVDMSAQASDANHKLKVAVEALERLDKITVLAEKARFIISETLEKIEAKS
jgi:hypothetical protein